MSRGSTSNAMAMLFPRARRKRSCQVSAIGDGSGAAVTTVRRVAVRKLSRECVAFRASAAPRGIVRSARSTLRREAASARLRAAAARIQRRGREQAAGFLRTRADAPMLASCVRRRAALAHRVRLERGESWPASCACVAASLSAASRSAAIPARWATIAARCAFALSSVALASSYCWSISALRASIMRSTGL